MITVQYNGAERTINGSVWYAGETRQATEKQLAAWQAEHGDLFVAVGADPREGDTTDEVTDRVSNETKAAGRKKAAQCALPSPR